MKVLDTDRLTLRWFTPDDADFILELLNDPEWQRFIGDRNIKTHEAARDYIASALVGSYQRHGFGLYAIERTNDKTLVGMCGLVKRESLADIDLGFALLSRYAGHGFAYEAAVATLAWARDTLGLDRMVAITTLDNERSAHLLERLGMRYEQRMETNGEPLRLYSMSLQGARFG